MQNFLGMSQVKGENVVLDQETIGQVQSLLKGAAIKLVVKMHLSEACIKEVGEL